MSKAKYITISSSIPIYNILLDHLEKILDEMEGNTQSCSIPEVRFAIEKGYEKLKSYYSKTDKSYVYPIATSKY
jgi:hypothetical protein